MKRLTPLLILILTPLAALGATTQLNVMSFGARGSGVDDTTAIQRGLDMAAKVKVPLYFPPSSTSYSVTGLRVTNDVTIVMDPGARLVQQATANNPMLLFSGSNAATLRIKGGTFDGNAPNRLAYQDGVVDLTSILATTHHNKRLILEDVVFTNPLRAALRVAGPAHITDSRFLNIKTNSCTGNGTIGSTYAIFAQPTGYNPDLHIYVSGCEFVGQTGDDMERVYLAGQGIFVTEQENASPSIWNTNRYSVTIVNNRFVGLGGWFHSAEGAPIEVYNGADRPIIAGNNVSCFTQAGIKVQRTSGAIITGNQIRNGRNAYAGLDGLYEGVSQAIIYEPYAREGATPFIGDRAGEQHYNAIIANNLIENVQQTAIYVGGSSTLVQGNLIDGVDYGQELSPGFLKLDCIAILANDVEIKDNIIKNVPANAIISTGNFRDIRVIDNKIFADQAASTRGGIVFANTTGLEIRGNYMVQSVGNAGSGVYVDSATNVVIEANIVVNAAQAYHVSASTNVTLNHNIARNSAQPLALTTSTNTVQWNNSWKPGYRIVDKLSQSAMGLSTTDTNIGASFTIEAGAKYFEFAGVGNDGEFLPGSKQGDAVIDFSGGQLLIGRPGKTIISLDAATDRMQLNGPLWISAPNSQLTFLSLADNSVPQYFTWYYYPGGVSTQRGWMGYSTPGSDALIIQNALNGGIRLIDSTLIWLVGPTTVTGELQVTDASGVNRNMRLLDNGNMEVRGDLTIGGAFAAPEMNITTINAFTIGVSTSVTTPFLAISGTGQQVTFGATNTAPVNPTTPTKWISVQVQGESATYRMPLYE